MCVHVRFNKGGIKDDLDDLNMPDLQKKFRKHEIENKQVLEVIHNSLHRSLSACSQLLV